jgi:hypothetical protein
MLLSNQQNTIRVRNFNCVNQNVKLFYTQTTGDNGIYDITNDDLRKELLMTSDDWGNNFLTADGSVWVPDGQTLPFSFSAALDCELLGATGIGILTDLTTQVGEPIDTFFLRLMEKLATQIGGSTPKGLGNASPMGVHIFYVGDVCHLNLIQYTRVSGSSYVPQAFEITTGSLFPQTNFGGTKFPYLFRLEHPDGWFPCIEVENLDVEDEVIPLAPFRISGYQIFLQSLLNQDLMIDELRKYSTNTSQVNEPLRFESFDVDGNEQKLTQSVVVDPYQAQPALEDFSGIVLNGQVFATVLMLAGEVLELRITYDASGVLHYDEILKLERLLEEQGVILDGGVSDQEKKDLQEAYSNFNGFDGSKKNNNIKTVLLISLLVLLILK